MQFLAQGLRDGVVKTALVITPRPAGELLKALRDGIRASIEGPPSDTQVKQHLGKVMLSCVFDMDGVWEVLADLDRPPAPPAPPSPPALEIQDSQDEDDDISPPPKPQPQEQSKTSPDIIIITHVSSLLTSLFTHRSSSAAHSALQLVSSHLRHLSRTLPSHPLVLLLNSTTSTTSPSNPASNTTNSGSGSGSRPLDPTLRSVFNPPAIPGYPGAALSRRNKPTFGLVFTQMLDVHLLCTRVPRSATDAKQIFAPQGQGQGQGEYVTVVEVLLDEMGVWEQEQKRGVRGSREQRWGTVEVKDRRVVDAFAKGDKGKKEYGEVRLAAGFGGPRV